ncbi:MAG TPA: phenylalanine--tRNA ligase subunit beta [Terriglobia bacterium]|nr:phenylalanine--tRNA ligase subunit beta [Terriglobia bacterium]
MKISYNWLKEFVDVLVDPGQLKVDLISLGLGVESVTDVAGDHVLDLEVTTNRPDCLSHYGIGRELATFYRLPLKPVHASLKESNPPASGEITIEIADPSLCARYCGRIIQNVQVKPSPEWLQRRLEITGVRSINNVADITNYVLMEIGHPLHAFDLARVRQRKIAVRRALPGEQLRTLDGVDRLLKPEHLVIADGERALALAGIMGGEESEISWHTRAVLLESAWFDPLSIRRTSKAQGLHTEASHRFERGADIEMGPVAIDRVAALIQELAGGEVLRGVVDIYPRPWKPPQIYLREQEIRRILGTPIRWDEVDRILRSLHFDMKAPDASTREVAPPSFRLDVTREVDLIEEIARHIGYDHLPSRLVAAAPPVKPDLRREKAWALTSALTALGYREIVTTTLVDPAEDTCFSQAEPVVITNPLSQEASALRRSAVPSMIRAARWNLDRNQANFHLFEFGKIYFIDAGGKPREKQVLTLGLSGFRRSASVHDTSCELGFFDLKGDLETVLELFDINPLVFSVEAGGTYQAAIRGSFHVSGHALVSFGRLDSQIERSEKLRQSLWMAEIDLERLLAFSLRPITFHSYSKFPAVERDFSLLVPERVRYAEIQQAITGLQLPEIRSFAPIDKFRGGSIAAGCYSLLLRVTFQSLEATLTGEAVDEASGKLLRVLASQDIQLRS